MHKPTRHELVLRDNLTAEALDEAPIAIYCAVEAVMTPEVAPSEAEDRYYEKFLEILTRHDPNQLTGKPGENYCLEADLFANLAICNVLDYENAILVWHWSFGPVSPEQGLALHAIMQECFD